MRKCKISSGRYDYVGSYEGTAKKLLKELPKAKIYGVFYQGKFLTGNQSLHRTQAARNWRLFWRLKTIRRTKELLSRS
jgi:hypothetical protein